MTVTIPSTLDEAKEQLNALGRLLTAKEWERAAIIWAFTSPSQGQRTDLTSTTTSQSLSFKAFAAQGIQGLRSRDTVRDYWQAWGWAIDTHGAREIVPGDEIELPNVDWNDWVEFSKREDLRHVARMSGMSYDTEHAMMEDMMPGTYGSDEDDESDWWNSLTPEQRAERVAETVRSEPQAAQRVAADREAREAVARANFEYDGEAEEMANLADPQRAEMQSNVDSMRYREKMREWRRLGDELAAWTDRAELSESETRASVSDAKIVQNAARLIESKLSGQFDRDLSALLGQGE